VGNTSRVTQKGINNSAASRTNGISCYFVRSRPQVAAYGDLLNSVRYYTVGSDVNNISDKLYINSKPDEITFENGQSVLLLSPLKGFSALMDISIIVTDSEDSGKDGLYITEDSGSYASELIDFNSSLVSIASSLDLGYYEFDLYFYACH
jgi:hypothetical protein